MTTIINKQNKESTVVMSHWPAIKNNILMRISTHSENYNTSVCLRLEASTVQKYSSTSTSS